MDYKLFIHPILYSFCQFNDNGFIDEIAPINNQYENEEKLVCFVKAISNESVQSELMKMEGLPPREYIHNEKYTNTFNKKYRDQIIKLLEDNIVMIATSSQELTPSNLSPHKIHLKPGARPIKQKFYRISKLKRDIFKEELTKLINKRLIEPSYLEWS